jgi:hypothetical protein
MSTSIIEGPFRGRQLKLMSSRKNYSQQQFTDYFISLDVTNNLSNIVWNELRAESSIDNFKPSPDDNIVFVFGLYEEDFEEFLVNLADRCDKKLPSESELKNMAAINTVQDLIIFLSKCEDKT